MPPLAERIIGIALIIGALVGLLLNAVGFLYLPRVQRGAQERVQTTLVALDATLDTTAAALDVIVGSLEEATETMETVESTTLDVAQALDDTVPLVESIESITGEELPASLQATQLALESAGNAANAIESMLVALNTSLALFGGGAVYDPEVPLATTVDTISASLEPLSSSLEEVETSIDVAGDNLIQVQENVELLAANLDEISFALEEAQVVAAEYQDAVEQQQAILADLRANADTWVLWAVRIFALVLTWLLIAQLGLLSQGIEMVLRSRRVGEQT